MSHSAELPKLLFLDPSLGRMWTILTFSLVATSSAFSPAPMSVRNRAFLDMKAHQGAVHKAVLPAVLSGMLLLNGMAAPPSFADDAASFTKVPLYAKKSSDLTPFADTLRGFRMLKPFGYNEFDGAGTGYAVKFASLFDVDENVVIGSAPASAGKTSIADYGSLESLGEKLATKRGGKLLESEARMTDDIAFYKFKFENPLDANLPRTGPKDKRPTVGIEWYELCVHRGKLWSVQVRLRRHGHDLL